MLRKEMKLLLFSLCLVSLFLPLLGGCIKGGDKVNAYKYPFIARLLTDIPRGGRCTGSLVKNNLILTAAHCFVKNGHTYEGGTATFFDASQECAEGNEMKIGMKLVKTYKGSDLALARLDRKVKGIMPAKINRKKFKPGSSVRVVGFGMHDYREQDWHLRHIILEMSFFNGTYLGTKLGPNKEGPCRGDSGGPLMVQAGGRWSILGTLPGHGYDCYTDETDADHPDDVWSSVRVMKSDDLRRCMKSKSC